MAFWNDVTDKIKNTAQVVSSKTRDGVELTRLSAQERSVAAELNTLYTQIGRSYVDGESSAALNDLCTRVKNLRSQLDDISDQKAALRNQNRCPVCGATVDKAARFCPSCGRRMPEPVIKAKDEKNDASYCPDCGAMHAKDERFCAVCGHSYEEQTPAADPGDKSAVEIDLDNESPNDFNAE